MSEKAQNVQDVFLNHLRKNKTPVTIFLVNGVKLRGSSPGSTTSRCCCAATAIRSLSTSMRSRPSCRSRRCSCSTGTRPTQRADLTDDIERNGQRQAQAQGVATPCGRRRSPRCSVLCVQARAARSATARPSSRRRSGLPGRSTSTCGWPRPRRCAGLTPATLVGKGVVERAEGRRGGAGHRPGDRRRQADARCSSATSRRPGAPRSSTAPA